MEALRLARIFYPLYANLYLKPKARVRYRREHAAARGNLASTNDQPSVLLFTTHKCASTWFDRLLAAIDAETSYEWLDYDSWFAGRQVPVDQGFRDRNFLEKGFEREGFVYGPMRTPRNIPDKNTYRVVLALRDPRDVMVSLYYSMRYSHQLMSRNMIDIRLEAEQHTVDSYALANMEEYRQRYQDYMELLGDDYTTHFVRYEALVGDPGKQVADILAFLETPLPAAVTQSLVNALAPASVEDIHSHKRSGEAGQFRSQLQPATIDVLNQEFKEVLEFYGF